MCTATTKNLSIRYTPSVAIAGAGNLFITAARCSTEYLVLPIGTDFAGRAFVLAKVAGGPRGSSDEPNYDVFIADAGSREHDSCTCPGHTYRPNQPQGCKHLQAMRAVLANGGFAIPAPKPAAEPIPAPIDAAEELPSVEAMLARIEAVGARWFAEQAAPAIEPAEALDALTALLFGKPVAKPVPTEREANEAALREIQAARAKQAALPAGKRDTADLDRW